MPIIDSFAYDPNKLLEVKKMTHGLNWPVVYILEDGNEIYIGETVSAYHRTKQHYKDPERAKLKNIHIIYDDENNISATKDAESSLIQYISADGKYVIQNANKGLTDHNYFDRPRYQAKFEQIWRLLQEKKIALQELREIRNSDLFKYSPYKSLSESQYGVADEIFDQIIKNTHRPILVRGGAGTGKTVLATYIFKLLVDSDETKHYKIGLVVPMTALRQTIKQVFKQIKGLKANMVLAPSEVVKNDYDILIVDEAHRLHKRKNITNYRSHDEVNRNLGLDKTGNELDWIMLRSKFQILFYDPKQDVHPSGVGIDNFERLNSVVYDLNNQMRLQGGDGAIRYEQFVRDFFENINPNSINFGAYDFKLYDNLKNMVSDIKKQEQNHSLCRMISGYAWEWVSKKDPEKHDIKLDGVKLKWNSVNQNWVYSKNAVNEVGCIHTVQGYDLNYAGLIIGPELSYNENIKNFVINREHYKDINGRKGVDSDEDLKSYILNIYQTLMLRGMLGTYVYIVDPSLRKHFHNILGI